MSALAAKPLHREPDAVDVSWGAMRLSGLLAATADRHADRTAFNDQSGRAAWSGRPPVDWAYPAAYDAIQRLSEFLLKLKLPRKSPVGICLPNGSEACLALLAVEHAGLVPCLLPVAWPEEDLTAAVEAANIAAIITQTTIGEERPADIFCRLAARYFGLRFICAFGPAVPDGVTDLDQVIGQPGFNARAPLVPESTGENGIVTFWRQGEAVRPVFRPCQSVIAAAVTFLVTAKIQAGDRIVSLIAPDDHCGITTGLIASLLSGATLECHGLFSAHAFVEALEDPTPTHLIAPAWMETSLARASLPETVSSVILIHEVPTRFRAKTLLRAPTVDVLAFGELAMIAASRKGSGQFSLSLDEDLSRGKVTSRHLLRIRRSEEGAIEFGGLAADIRDFGRGASGPAQPQPEWRRSGFRTETFAGVLIGIARENE